MTGVSFRCQDRDAALRAQEPESLAALADHARTCPACAEELRAWDEISGAAAALRGRWESPGLWARIQASLAAQPQRQPWWRSVLGAGRLQLASPRLALATAALGIVALALGLLVMARLGPAPAHPPAEAGRRLLTENALAEVETAETAYVRAIDGLAARAEPMLRDPRSPLLASYRERLLLIDAAIAECRAQAERNRFNAHLRHELLAVYQEKRMTLEQVLKEGTDVL